MKTKKQIKEKLRKLEEFASVYSQAERPIPSMVIGTIETLKWVLY